MNDSSTISSGISAPSLNVSGANDRITVAIIGLGYIAGRIHLYGFLERARQENIAVAAVSDVFEKRRMDAVKRAKLKGSDVYLDYREILDRKDIDAVVVATHDPLHAQISLDCLEAGKHVYCERPMTRHLGEAFAVYDKVKSTGKVFQLSVPSCTSGGLDKTIGLIRGDAIGKLVWSECYYGQNGGPSCDGNALIDKESTPKTIDWNKWLGPLKPCPFNPAHFHQWRMYSDYSAGLLGCLAPFQLHALMRAPGSPEFPSRVTCIGGFGLRHPMFQWPNPPQLPAHIQLLAEFPSGYVINLNCSWMNGRASPLVFYGHRATLEIGPVGDRVQITPEKKFENEVRAENVTGLSPLDMREHEKNWFDCIRSGKQPNADIELAIRAQVVLSLAEISNLRKTTCLFDPATRKITDGAGNEITPPSYEG